MTMQRGSSIVVRLVGDSSRLEQSLTRAERRIQSFDKRIKSTMASAAKIGAVAGIAATTAAVGKSILVFASYEKQMSRVRSVSGANEKQFRALEQVTKDLGKTTKFTATQAAEGLTFLSMAGMDVQHQVGALPVVLNLATAANLELGTSADIVTNIMSGLGIQTKDLAATSDKLVATMTNSNVTMDELGQTFSYVGPAARGAGIPIDELSAAVGILGNNGIKASKAGTSLRQGLLQLINPTAGAEKTLAKLGLQMDDLSTADGKLKPLSDILDILNAKGMTIGDAAKIFGTEAATGWFAMVQDANGEYDKLLAKIRSSEGITDQISTTMMDNIAGQWILFKSALEGVALTIGSSLLPVVKPLLEGILDLARGVSDFIDAWTTGNKVLVGDQLLEGMSKLDHVILQVKESWEKVLVVLRPVSAFLLSAWKGVKVITETSWLWKSALVAVSGVIVAAFVPAILAMGAALATNPVVLLATAFLGLAAIVGKVDEKFGRIPAIITAVTGGIGILTLVLLVNGKAWWENTKAAWTNASTHIKAAVTRSVVAVKTAILTVALLANAVAWKTGTVAALVNVGAHIKAGVVYAVLAVKAGILTVAQWALNAAMYANPIGLVVLAIVALVGAVVLAIKYWDKITAAVNWLWDAFKKLPAPIKVFIAIFAWLPLLIIGLVKAINWLRENWRSVWDAIPKTFEDASKAILKLFYFGFGWMLPGGLLARAYGWLRETLTSLWRRVTGIWDGAKRILGVEIGEKDAGGASVGGPGVKKGFLERLWDTIKANWALVVSPEGLAVAIALEFLPDDWVQKTWDAIKKAWQSLTGGGGTSTTVPLPGGRNATAGNPVLSIGIAAANTPNVAGIWADIKKAWKAINPALNVAVGFPRRAGTAIWNAIKSAFDKAKSLLSVAIGIAGLPADWATKAFAAIKTAWTTVTETLGIDLDWVWKALGVDKTWAQIKKDWDALTTGVSIAVDWVWDTATSVWADIKKAWTDTKEDLGIDLDWVWKALAVDKTWEAIKKDWDALTTIVSISVDWVWDTAKSIWATIKAAWGKEQEDLDVGVGFDISTIWADFKKSWNDTKEDLGVILDWLWKALDVAGIWAQIKKDWDALKAGVGIAVSWVVDTVANIWAGIKKAWTDTKEDLDVDLGFDVSGLWNGIKAAWKALTKDNLPIGIWFVAGAGKRIFDGIKAGFDAAKSTLSVSLEWVGKTAATAWAELKSAWDGLVSNLGISVGTSTSGTSTTTGLATSAKQNTANTALSDIKTKLDTGNKSLASISTSAWTSKFELIKIRIAIVDGLIGFAKRTDGWLENILRTLTPKQTTSSTAGFKSIPGVIQGRGAPGANDRIYWYGGPSRTQVSDFSAAGQGYAQFLKKWLGSGGGGTSSGTSTSGGTDYSLDIFELARDRQSMLVRISAQLQNIYGALTETAIGNWPIDVPSANQREAHGGGLSRISAAQLKAYTPFMSITAAIKSMRDTLKSAIDKVSGKTTDVVDATPNPSGGSRIPFGTRLTGLTNAEYKQLDELARKVSSSDPRAYNYLGIAQALGTWQVSDYDATIRSLFQASYGSSGETVWETLKKLLSSTTINNWNRDFYNALVSALSGSNIYSFRSGNPAQGVTGVGGPGGPGTMPTASPERVVYNFNIKMDSGGAGDDFETRFRKMIRKLQREGVLPRPA